MPACFFRSRPLIVGTNGNRLYAASYNTFSSIGKGLELPAALNGEATALPRGVRSSADFKRVGLKTRLLADDQFARIVYCFRNRLALVPLSEMNIPDEPFMALRPVERQLTVGESSNVQIEPLDGGVSVELGDLPENARKVDGGFEWTPGDRDTGPVTLQVTLTFKDLVRVVDVPLEVSQPFVRTPFPVSSLTIDQDAKLAVCWSGPGIDQYGRPVPREAGRDGATQQLAIVPLDDSFETRSREVSYSIRKVILAGSMVAVLPADENSRVEILNARTLDRVKTLLSTEPLTDVSYVNEEILLHGQNVVDVYRLDDFRHVRSIGSPSAAGTAHTRGFRDGVLIQGVLHDQAGKTPRLLLSPGRFPAMPGADSKLFQGSFLRQVKAQESRNARRSSRQGASSVVAGPVSLSGTGATVSLEQSQTQIRPSNSVHTYLTQHRLTLVVFDADGTLKDRIPILNRTGPNPKVLHSGRPLLLVRGHRVFVVSGDQIFSWKADAIKDTPDSEEPSNEFHVKPQQSQFVVSEPDTKLSHTVVGGRRPYEFFLFTRLNGVSMDDDTGVITLSREKLLAEARTIIEQKTNGTNDIGEAVQRLQAESINLVQPFVQPFVQLMSRKPTGFPFAVPIRFKVIDENGNVAELQYFVLLEISFREITSMLSGKEDDTDEVKQSDSTQSDADSKDVESETSDDAGADDSTAETIE